MTCPICKREASQAYRPFCSKRCADVDLGRWMTGSYVIETEEPETDEPAPDRPDLRH